jgi:hypothetical protein
VSQVDDPIAVRGLREFVRDLRKIDAELPKELRLGLNRGAELVAEWARPRIPAQSGKARRSIRATSTRTAAKVTGGGARVPYYPWLDFGGRVGRKRSVHRPFDKHGRAIFPGYTARRDEVQAEIAQALVEVARRAGFDVKEG